MFNSLRKWVRSDESPKAPISPQSVALSPPTKMQTIRPDLQKKFAKGVHYNMKIIIRGSRSSGKTSLWTRLQGEKFSDDYTPTPEIQTTSIHWNYKATDDIVKVDVWDVVDKGINKSDPSVLKLTNDANKKDNDEESLPQHKLDASFVNVYKGAHAVIFIFDIANRSSFDYVEKELSKAPSHIPCLILANNKDSESSRKVYQEEVGYLIESANRPPGTPAILCLESSMKNGFGLKYIHKFFNLPFLLLQRESLMKQLQMNHLDVESCLEELQLEEGNDYDSFMKAVQDRAAGKSPPVTTPSSPIGPPPPTLTPTSVEISKQSSTDPQKEKKPSSGETNESKAADDKSKQQQQTTQQQPARSGFMSRFFRGKQQQQQDETASDDKNDAPKTASASSKSEQVSNNEEEKSADAMGNKVEVTPNIDDFVPELDCYGDDDDFFDDATTATPSVKTKTAQQYDEAESSDDEDETCHNPMVAAYQESIDSESSPDEAHYHVTEEIDDGEEEEGYEVVGATEETVDKLEQRDEVDGKSEVVELPVSSDDDEEMGDGNPMVMGYADDVSEDDDVISREQPPLDDYEGDVTDGNDDEEFDSKMNPAEDAASTTTGDMSVPLPQQSSFSSPEPELRVPNNDRVGQADTPDEREAAVVEQALSKARKVRQAEEIKEESSEDDDEIGHGNPLVTAVADDFSCSDNDYDDYDDSNEAMTVEETSSIKPPSPTQPRQIETSQSEAAPSGAGIKFTSSDFDFLDQLGSSLTQEIVVEEQPAVVETATALAPTKKKKKKKSPVAADGGDNDGTTTKKTKKKKKKKTTIESNGATEATVTTTKTKKKKKIKEKSPKENNDDDVNDADDLEAFLASD